MTLAGYWGLFLSAFVASTLLPASSEVVLGALATAADYDLVLLVAIATTGNTLGAIVNWLLGRFCLQWRDRNWFPFKARDLDRAAAWFQRFGTWSLLLAWLPIIGDPLTFAAGFLRVRFPVFVILVAIGKGARYVVVAAVVRGVFG